MMNNKVVFLNITWMKSYNGLRNDSVVAGGEYIKENGWGHEIFNFADRNGHLYGYAAIQGDINIDKIGANKSDDYIDGATVIWTAKRDNGGTYIIGWYKNAKVFRTSQKQNRKFKNQNLTYYVTCEKTNAILLSEDERVFEVPRGRNGFGQRNIWYALKSPEYILNVMNYIQSGYKKSKAKKKRFKIDSSKRKKVEISAINKATDYYQSLGYVIKSVESENLGWDLEAVQGKIKLKIEVKGLSGKDVNAELTHNEYLQLNQKVIDYRLCIVTEALTNPKLNIFSYSVSDNAWSETTTGIKLNFKEFTSARAYA